MPCSIVDEWLASGRSARISPHRLRPVEHPHTKGKPLSSQKGQAEAFFLKDDAGNVWILKKFRKAWPMAPSYLEKVTTVLPKDRAFLCGTKRQILTSGTLQKAKGSHYSRDLDRWLDGTILMPRVQGVDWACLADELRDGEVILEPPVRLALCRDLVRIVELLEAHRCAHRDFSCGNIFIEAATGEVSLIDFDTLFHPSIAMPDVTTCGTEGYTAPYAWVNGDLDPSRTWCEGADRYALALLNAEILLVGPDSDATSEGGIFSQTELQRRSGKGIDSIMAALRADYPEAASLLQQAIQSHTPADCPSPAAWDSVFQGMPAGRISQPKLSDLPDPSVRIADMLTRSRPAAPLWPAPNLRDTPPPVLQLPASERVTIPGLQLPPDPWAKDITSRANRMGRSGI